MKLTDKQNGFVDQIMRGASNRDAALAAGYAPKAAAEAGARLARHPKVMTELEHRRAAARIPAKGAPPLVKYDDPLEYLLALVNDPGIDLRLRVDAAKALLPYLNRKATAAGKKEQLQAAANGVTLRGAFAPSKAPVNRVVPIRRPDPLPDSDA